MAQTFWSGPLASGDRPPGSPGGSNVGLVVLNQTVLIPFTAALIQTATINLPFNSRITAITVDTLTAFNAAGTEQVSVGTAATPTLYASGVDVKTAAGRQSPTFTAAQLAAMADTLQVAPVEIRVTSSSGNPSAGLVRVTIEYVQTRGD